MQWAVAAIVPGLVCLLLVLWATGSLTGLGATPIAMLAVSIMLIAGVLTWKDILAEKGARNRCSGWAG